MEEQRIMTSTSPRITFKRTSVKRKCAWEIASSSSKDKEELKKIILMIEELDKDMGRKFSNPEIIKK